MYLPDHARSLLNLTSVGCGLAGISGPGSSLTFKVPVTPGAQLTIISFTTYLFNSWLVNMCCTMSQEFQEIII